MPAPNRPALSPHLYTEEYFREACEGYDEFNETNGARLSRRLQAAFSVAQVTRGMRVLDVGCGRGEILRHCAALGAAAFGVDYAPVAVELSRQVLDEKAVALAGVAQSDAKHLPFPSGSCDRVFMFDVVEHLYPWELQAAFHEVRRVLHADGLFVLHTAPNAWYDRFAYPLVRAMRRMGGTHYPANPRALNTPANVEVHVNEQSAFSLWRALRGAGFGSRVWLESPPQNRTERAPLAALRHVSFRWPPFRWFFEREVFAVAWKL